jgi:lipopolysaccharide transport system permease protein
MDNNVTESITVYEPNQRVNMGYLAGWAMMFGNLLKSRELIWQLFKRDFFANYKQSFLGIMWVFIAPVIAIVSWVFLNATGVLVPGDVGVPYPLYVLLGSTIWGLFLSFYSNTAKSLTEYGQLITQINFPHEALVAKQVAQSMAAFVINVVLILVVLAAFRFTPNVRILLFPLTVIPLLFVGAGIGMVISVVSAVAHDVEKVVTAMLGFVMYITPVIYSPDQESELMRTVLAWNPLTYLICMSRATLLDAGYPVTDGYILSAGISAVFFMFSWRLFFLSEGKVSERL